MEPPPTKILVVDDDLHIATAIMLALGSGSKVETLPDAHAAFEVLKDNAQGFDIVITDHMMPGWAGWELIKRLQETAFAGKCIVLSGNLSPAIEAIYRSFGVEHVIHKPFDLAQLRDAVEASVREIESQRR